MTGLDRALNSAIVEVRIAGSNGASVPATTVVTLLKLDGQFYRQTQTSDGRVSFVDVAPSEYTLQVVAPGYETAVKQFDTQGSSMISLAIELHPVADVEEANSAARVAVLPLKAQREVSKALEALRSKKAAEARVHLDAAYRLAPNDAEINFLYGVYWSQVDDLVRAKSYLMKAIELYPKHISALLTLSDLLLQEKKLDEALPYLHRAVEAEPTSWRAHAILAKAYLLLGARDEAIVQAQRALELGKGRAAIVQILLARALAERGEKEKAIHLLQAFLHDHPTDGAAAKQLASLQTVEPQVHSQQMAASPEAMTVVNAATSLPLASNWLPPDIDEKVPLVEPGVACPLDVVTQKAGKRVQEFIANVDRFTATESLVHESVNKSGLVSSLEKRKFDYVASIEELRAGYFNVEEYRSNDGALGSFPGGIATNGLPALVLIFHPHIAGNFEMVCEGLARWNGRLAWQVHFRQRSDKPNIMRSYKFGADRPSYPVALKGRAWIEADSYQIVRLETDMVAPLPQIRLAADRTAIDYAPVQFRERNVDMWLPSSAEVYFDLKGRRFHRRHSFSRYLLFSVDDQQHISGPKPQNEESSDSSAGTANPSP